MCFVWIWEQTAIISLYNINWLVCITETECVYCAVRTGSLYIIQVMCFVWIWEQTAIISLYSINWLVCITETECVYCAVRTGSLIGVNVAKPGNILKAMLFRKSGYIGQWSIFTVLLAFNSCAAIQTIGRRLLASETRVWSQVSPCEICGGPSGTVTVFLPVLLFSPVSIVPTTLHTYPLFNTALSRMTNGWSLGTF